MDHLSDACLGKENCELVSSLSEAKAPPAKMARLEQNGSPQGRSRLGSTGTKLTGGSFKPSTHLFKTCHKRGEWNPFAREKPIRACVCVCVCLIHTGAHTVDDCTIFIFISIFI